MEESPKQVFGPTLRTVLIFSSTCQLSVVRGKASFGRDRYDMSSRVTTSKGSDATTSKLPEATMKNAALFKSPSSMTFLPRSTNSFQAVLANNLICSSPKGASLLMFGFARSTASMAACSLASFTAGCLRHISSWPGMKRKLVLRPIVRNLPSRGTFAAPTTGNSFGSGLSCAISSTTFPVSLSSGGSGLGTTLAVFDVFRDAAEEQQAPIARVQGITA
mmetsp:Transcript_91844/g.230796  ORF Transcript_91844/g.230796 Transcript_91844/m.230796 type:complete len:219 (+) Transcript_91844:2155-2811(+)